jgi:hypothetical protein
VDCILGTFTDIYKILSDVNARVKDRKAASDLREIQRMLLSFQAEQAALQEEKLKLMTENADLKSRIICAARPNSETAATDQRILQRGYKGASTMHSLEFGEREMFFAFNEPILTPIPLGPVGLQPTAGNILR